MYERAFLLHKIDNMSPPPATVQKLRQNIEDLSAASFCCHSVCAVVIIVLSS